MAGRRGDGQDRSVQFDSERRVVLVVDAAATVNRSLAARCISRAGLSAAFATDAGEALAAAGSGEVAAFVVLPPLGHSDAFALVAAVRRRNPHTIGAIVLGEGRFQEAAPRVLWSNREPVPIGVIEAVAGVAALHQPVDDHEHVSWDETTAELGDLAAE
jgi:CheY-like chemotaxis protein